MVLCLQLIRDSTAELLDLLVFIMEYIMRMLYQPDKYHITKITMSYFVVYYGLFKIKINSWRILCINTHYLQYM